MENDVPQVHQVGLLGALLLDPAALAVAAGRDGVASAEATQVLGVAHRLATDTLGLRGATGRACMGFEYNL